MSRRTLLLSAWYLPQRVIAWEDAVKLVYLGSVDVLAEYDEVIRSPSVTWRTPAVIRQRRAVPPRALGVRFSRANVYLRDSYTCQYCTRTFPERELTMDHVVPRSRGGRRAFTNIVTACRPCNSRKANRTCDQAGMFPLRAPHHPRALPLDRAIAAAYGAPVEWQPYLVSEGGG
ncbi:MAG: HNH endonuclease [Deltaproteobacteria bacterium]|nr:HNH endonuclease [Deltaproteobacteria bacterium]